MGKSFFNGRTDGELAAGSKNFAARISTGWAELGISEEMALAYVALDAEWQAAYQETCTPKTRTSSQVATKNQLRRQVTAMASSLGQIICGNPDVSDGQRLTLGLSVRDKASPLPAPGQPYQLSKTLDGDGSLILSWKCDNPKGSRGTQYEVWRQLAGGPAVFLRMVGVKRYRDNTLPEGATGIVYKLRATRSTKVGDWATFPVSIGGGMPSAFETRHAA